MRYLSFVLALTIFGSGLAVVGCDNDREIKHEEKTKVKDDGTVEKKEETVKQRPDGTVQKEEKKTEEKR
jgi:hypothetical protein